MTSPTQEYRPYLEAIFDRKPKSVTALHVENMTSYTDMVVVVEAGSSRQVTSLAEHLINTLKKNDIQALGVEGVKQGQWALLDYGHILIHVFESEAKTFYDIEGLWSDAPRLDLSDFGALDPQTDDEDNNDF